MSLFERAFFDSSVLVPGVVAVEPAPRPSQLLLDRVAAGEIEAPLTAWHCCLEFYAVTTRLPGGLALSSREALFVLREEILRRFEVHQLDESRFEPWVLEAAAASVAGGRIYDLHIAEVARAARATVMVTNNPRHFGSLLRHGLRVLTAAEALAALDA